MNKMVRFSICFLVSLALTTFLIQEKKLVLPKETDTKLKICSGLNAIFPSTSLVIRHINNSNNKTVIRCLEQELERNNIVMIASKKNNQRMVNEMLLQSELPTKAESLIPIGQMLVPDHLLVTNSHYETHNRSFKFSLLEIKSGKIIKQRTINISLFELYEKYIYITLVAFFFTMIIYIPLQGFSNIKNMIKTKSIQQELSITEYDRAIKLIKADLIQEGVDLLIKVSKNRVNGGAYNKADIQLKKFANII